jgi:hypothetical protein
MPAIHAGMTDAADGQNAVYIALVWRDATLFSCSVGERKIMKHFVLRLGRTLYDWLKTHPRLSPCTIKSLEV